ncbi:hypothetical protein ACGF8B_24760 [Streptomyces sp. NPDC047917]|uniref:hypothetical protein n=1 Tax=Streptomyces sp. NPDC047917 TaxID=3365491 RepID=UPI0037240034
MHNTTVRTRLGLFTATGFLGVGSLLVSATTAGAAAPAPAGASDKVGVGAQSVVYIPGKDVTSGSCKGWLNRRSSDGYVQALVQSWGARCAMWLERADTYPHYKQISYVYEAQLNKRSTGFHWNGRGAGARVCIVNKTLGQTTPYCGSIAW